MKFSQKHGDSLNISECSMFNSVSLLVLRMKDFIDSWIRKCEAIKLLLIKMFLANVIEIFQDRVLIYSRKNVNTVFDNQGVFFH